METRIGYVTHYYNRISVAVVSLDHPLNLNDNVLFLGHSTDFTQKVWSMEIEHHKIQSAGAGAEVAIKVVEPVRRGDQVFLVPEKALIGSEM